MLQTFFFQEPQDGTGMDKTRSSWKLLYVKVGLSPFLLMNLYHILQYYSCTGTTLQNIFKTFRSNRMTTAILNLLLLSGQEDGYYKMHSHVTPTLMAKRDKIFQIFKKTCINSDQTFFSNTLSFARSIGRC